MSSSSGTSLKSYALTRLALVIPMVLILLTMVFLLMCVAPGNPISASLGGHVPPAVIDDITKQLGGKVQKSPPKADGQHDQPSHGHSTSGTGSGGGQHGQPLGSGAGYSGPTSTF